MHKVFIALFLFLSFSLPPPVSLRPHVCACVCVQTKKGTRLCFLQREWDSKKECVSYYAKEVPPPISAIRSSARPCTWLQRTTNGNALYFCWNMYVQSLPPPPPPPTHTHLGQGGNAHATDAKGRSVLQSASAVTAALVYNHVLRLRGGEGVDMSHVLVLLLCVCVYYVCVCLCMCAFLFLSGSMCVCACVCVSLLLCVFVYVCVCASLSVCALVYGSNTAKGEAESE